MAAQSMPTPSHSSVGRGLCEQWMAGWGKRDEVRSSLRVPGHLPQWEARQGGCSGR